MAVAFHESYTFWFGTYVVPLVAMIMERDVLIQTHRDGFLNKIPRWWFQIFFMFTPTTLPETNSAPMKIPIFPVKYHQNGGFSSQLPVSLQECTWGRCPI